MAKFVFQREISDARIDKILELFDNIHKRSIDGIDFQRVETILPAGQAILACLTDKIVETQSKVHLMNLSPELRESWMIQALKKYRSSTTFPEIDAISHIERKAILRASLGGLDPLFLDQVDEYFGQQISPTQLWFIRFIFNELMQNAIDHSSAERYFMYVGLEGREIHFGITDLGVSIPAKLEQKYICSDDVEYLLKSLERGVGTRRNREGGLGLHYLFEVLKGQQGRLKIISRYGQVRKYFSRRKTETTLMKYPLRGTWIFARMPWLELPCE